MVSIRTDDSCLCPKPVPGYFELLSPAEIRGHGSSVAGIRPVTQIRAAKSELPWPHFSSGERKLKYPGTSFGHNQESSVRIGPIYLLPSSVPLRLRGAKVLFFACGFRGVLLLLISPEAPDTPDATDEQSLWRAVRPVRSSVRLHPAGPANLPRWQFRWPHDAGRRVPAAVWRKPPGGPGSVRR